ncbi:DUF4242 domain-containing protein [Desulfovibrio inopinatus]|uniref:DUF4242 domain-containing protein n=1 Tax=Desulfovibrio inopinatus TaxID=102109 RepID=UPI00041A3DAD|nr:DUF4242 domain-containing protein [Desulfovibrio inopinatus]
MLKMKLFIDTHDKENGTFPEKISQEDFSGVYEKYAAACAQEGVVIFKTLVNASDGKMYCLNMAPSAEAIRKAHEHIGLSFDSIHEVATASPEDMHFEWK